MSDELQARARAFIAKPIPSGIDYVPDSLAERFIATYAQRGEVPLDPETRELLELTLTESREMALSVQHPESAAFFAESAALLAAILHQAHSNFEDSDG